MPREPDIYTRVTDRIISDLEAGTRPWLKPWGGEQAAAITLPLRHCGTPYRGINILMLWEAALTHDYSCPRWMTYRQANQLGGQVRKGERSSIVFNAGTFTREQENPSTGETEEVAGRFLKQYRVFNVEQIEGLPEDYYRRPDGTKRPAVETCQKADDFFAGTGADIRHGGGKAFYAIQPDYIRVPFPEMFRDVESYTATVAHELTHWTRHKSRLDRSFGRKRWGDEGYAAEELVAELGAAFLCAELEITPEPREDHAQYIASWLTVLKNDKRAIFTAAAHAQRALDYLHGLQPASGTTPDQQPTNPEHAATIAA
jgi:antirestriction protein ArdC